MSIIIMIVVFLECKKPLHTCLPLMLIMIHIEKVMAIVQMCESAQQIRALMMILQYHKTLSYDAIPMPYIISRVPLGHIYLDPGVVSCVFQQSL